MSQTPSNAAPSPSDAPATEEAQAAQAADAPEAELGPFRAYLRDSRSPLNSVLLVLPLFVVYQLGILITGGVRNGVDFVTDTLRFGIFGGQTLPYVIFNLVILAIAVGVVFVLRKKARFDPKLFGFVALEGTLYGLLLGGIIGGLLTQIGITPTLQIFDGPMLNAGPVDNFILSLGAGLYEELVFRLILLGGSVWLLCDVLKLPRVRTVIGAVIVTSLIFSAVHYVGNMADDLELYSFMFRFVAGMIFAGLYYARGFAVAVYTHAIYDVMVLVF